MGLQLKDVSETKLKGAVVGEDLIEGCQQLRERENRREREREIGRAGERERERGRKRCCSWYVQ